VTHYLWRTFVSAFLSGLRDRIRQSKRIAHVCRLVSIGVTFVAVNVAWIFFRATDIDSALRLIGAMFGFAGWMEVVEVSNGIVPLFPLYLIIVWGMPNTMQMFRKAIEPLHVDELADTGNAKPKARRFDFSLSRRWAISTAFAFVLAWFALSNLSPFIYFQF
jgi:alginate O-acetyltransferase complex protein AlgI